MCKDECLIPNINDGRFFVSPILGCSAACSYCYLKIKDYNVPRKNKLSKEDLFEIAKQSPNFIFGNKGTIISVGAWGDIFPLNNNSLINHSVDIIKYLLSWGNPVQIMSKNTINVSAIHEIFQEVQFSGQLLYSTSITTLEKWKSIEPGSASPVERLITASYFNEIGIPTNVLLKPFIPTLTDNEIVQIADLLLTYKINYCTIGIMYLTPEISKRIEKNHDLQEVVNCLSLSSENHLDCNGEHIIKSTSIEKLYPYVEYLRGRGIQTFLKSSCVSSNVLQVPNISNYYIQEKPFCINCGNCCN